MATVRRIKLIFADESVLPLEIKLPMQVIQLKQIIHQEKSINANNITLLCMGKQLHDMEMLDSYISANDQTIHVIFNSNLSDCQKEIQLSQDHINKFNAANTKLCPSFLNNIAEKPNSASNEFEELGETLQALCFQTERMIPNMSKLGDILQKETAVTDNQDRQDLDDICNTIGTAMHECIYATAHISSLVQNAKFGPTSEDKKLINNPSEDIKNIFTKEEEKSNIIRNPAVINSQIQQGISRMGNVINSMNTVYQQTTGTQSTEPAKQTEVGYFLSKSAKAFQQLSGVNIQNETLHTLADKIDDEEKTKIDLIIDEVMGDLSMVDAMGLMTGKFSEVITKIVPNIRKVIYKYGREYIPLDERKKGALQLIQLLDTMIQIPPEMQSQIKPNYNYVAPIKDALMTLLIEGTEIILNDNESSASSFAVLLNDIFLILVNNLFEGMNQNMQLLESFIKSVVLSCIVKKICKDQNSILMVSVAYDPMIKLLLNYYLSMRQKGQHIPSRCLPINEGAFIDYMKVKNTAKQAPVSMPKSRAYKLSGLFYAPLISQTLTSVQYSGNILGDIMKPICTDNGIPFSKIDLPQELLSEYDIVLANEIKARISRDTDYEKGKYQYIDMVTY